MDLPMPNFARVSTDLTDMAQDVAPCANLPAQVQNDHLVNVLNAFRLQLQNLEDCTQRVENELASLRRESRVR